METSQPVLRNTSAGIHTILAVLTLGMLTAALPASVCAAGKIKIAKALWSARTGKLVIAGNAKNANGPVEIYDLNGRRLGSGEAGKFALSIPAADLPTVPCGVRVQSGDYEALVKVSGAPQSCRRPISCIISQPVSGAALKVGEPLDFIASIKGKGPVFPVAYEWDFAGGADGHPTGTLGASGDASATASFVRDNSTYRVRFIATDVLGRRCEDKTEVVVGNPPSGLPAKVGESAAPKLGGELNGAKDDWVVLPFEYWTMQHFSDMRMTPNGQLSYNATDTSLNAHVIKKGSVGGSKPVFLSGDQVDLSYSAASNPSDPVGADSINSTSQNWPLNSDAAKPAPLMAAQVQKSDWWEKFERTPGPDVWQYYQSWSMMQVPFYSPYVFTYLIQEANQPVPDEGYAFHVKPPERNDFNFAAINPELTGTDLADLEQGQFDYTLTSYETSQKLVAQVNPDHGRYMPGKAAPYQANDAQAFSVYDAGNQWFAANMVPITDIDDRGRINPFPLLRVQAAAKGSAAPLAVTDAVLSNSRDFHCRECHAKGQIAANANAPHTQAAFHSSPWGQGTDLGTGHDHGAGNTDFAKPAFFDAAGSSLFDQEYAAALNYSSLHDFYDAFSFLPQMQSGITQAGLVVADSPQLCAGCHLSVPQMVHSNELWWNTDEYDYDNYNYCPNWSMSIHRFHGELQYNADKSDIVRDERGVFVRWKWADANNNPAAHNTVGSNTLFPIFDDQGRQLPMEENCLKCHAGKREQCYRDRMYTAGVTCYDCHGDMAAVGQAYKKPAVYKTADGNDYRIPWFNETDCGSCHQGDANRGLGDTANYFSGGVLRRAFAANDPSATPFMPDLNDLNGSRFAVVPEQNWEYPINIGRCPTGSRGYDECTFVDSTQKITARLFRAGKDQHAGIACAACHGGAHGIGPNRDPSANDNVTALQLQGHTGPIMECNVCHTQDAFNTLASIGSALHYPDKNGQPTLLAGPHSLHPVNDPYWWKEAPGDIANTDGSSLGGWHNNYAKISGLNGEDQCAACHGNDHKGTRLSKTPVDRVFDFRGLDFGKLKKAGFKSKIVKVAAGMPIGCDTCHRLDVSFTGSPGKAADRVEARLTR